MSDATALRIAIDIVHIPSRVRRLRSDPLPQGILMLLRIAAGQEEAEVEAADLIGRPRDLVRKSAFFFIEQVMLHPGADSYRVLGANPDATDGELRRNMALLLTWLHPDMGREGDRASLAQRVTTAWDELKTPERRAVHDDAMRLSQGRKAAAEQEESARSRAGRHAARMRHARAGAQDKPARRDSDVDGSRSKGMGLTGRRWSPFFPGTKR